MSSIRSNSLLTLSLFACVLVAWLNTATEAAAQQGGDSATETGRAAAPQSQDLTGTWIAVVTEYWHLRMTVPPKGEYSMLPLNPEGRRVADAWEPTDDVGSECRSYGAASIMRIPGRLRIQWADDDTLQVDIDSGTQTRMFHFDTAPNEQGPRSWQGNTVASWESAQTWGGSAANGEARYLQATTTGMLPGYLRKNGAPYSENTIMEEHFDMFTEPNGDSWLIVTAIITDPQYLTRPYAVTNHFKKLRNNSGWDPTPCSADQPR
jgi:hypothetical protein